MAKKAHRRDQEGLKMQDGHPRTNIASAECWLTWPAEGDEKGSDSGLLRKEAT